MTIIRVTPPTLRQSGQDLAQAGNNTARIGSDLWNVGASAPGYDGQFGSHVREMAAEANARAQGFANRLAEYTNRLENKASAFEAADVASVSGLKPVGLPKDWREALNMLGQFGLWIGMPIAAIELYLQLGLLTNLGPWAGRLITGLIPRSNFQVGWNGMTFQGIRVPPSLTQIIERIRNDVSGKGWKTDAELAEEKRKADEARRLADEKAAEAAKQRQIEETKKRVKNDIGRQQDGQDWSPDKMGDNNLTIGEVGCFITAIAMLARSEGVDVTPRDVNKYLRDHNGYEKGSSNLLPGVAEAFLNSVLHTNRHFANLGKDENGISAKLAKGQPVILHIPSKAYPNDGHFVLAVGNGDKPGTFVAYDPWTGRKTLIDIGQVTGAESF